MSVAIAIPAPPNESFRAQWDHVRAHFGLEECHIITPGELVELADQPIVMCQPVHGRFIQSNNPLDDFVHPNDATYLFGPEEKPVDKEFMDSIPEPTHSVYVPTLSRRDMFSWVACAVVMWDRIMKRRVIP